MERTYWLAVAPQEEIEAAVTGGYCQIGEGRWETLAKLDEGDWIVFYAPRLSRKGRRPVQAFLAIGEIADVAPWSLHGRHGPDATRPPFRRRLRTMNATPAAVRPLLDALGFVRDADNWGKFFRQGLRHISRQDFVTIAEALGVRVLKIGPIDYAPVTELEDLIDLPENDWQDQPKPSA